MNTHVFLRGGIRTFALLGVTVTLGATVASPAFAGQTGKTVACPNDADSTMLTADEVEWPAVEYMRGSAGGIAVVGVDIMANGSAQNARVVRSSGSYRLDEAAWRNVVHQRFSPRILACSPVRDAALVEVEFSR